MVFIFERLVLLCHLSGLWHDATIGHTFFVQYLYSYVLILSDTSPFCIILRKVQCSYNAYRIILTFGHVCVFLNCEPRVGPINVNESVRNVI